MVSSKYKYPIALPGQGGFSINGSGYAKKLTKMLKAAQAISIHLKGIMTYFTYRVTNAEMIFLVFGELKFEASGLI